MENLFALADQLEAPLSAAQRQVDALTPSLPPTHCSGATSLARAFSDQLVPQDPTGEPASALLEKIKSGRSSLHADARGGVLKE